VGSCRNDGNQLRPEQVIFLCWSKASGTSVAPYSPQSAATALIFQACVKIESSFASRIEIWFTLLILRAEAKIIENAISTILLHRS